MKPFHGEIQVLNEIECIQLLERNTTAHLGCHVHDQVYVVPITYACEGGYFYSHSQPGKKIEMMRENNKICIQVEEIHNFYHWKSVISTGKYEELSGDRASTAMRLLIKKVATQNEPESSLELDFTAMLESAIIYRMKIDSLSGRTES